MLRNGAIALILFLLNTAGVFSQAPVNDRPDRAIIAGKITEKADGHPIAYAEVAVLRENNVVTGTIANELGNYEIKNLLPGRYTVVAYIVGFKKSKVDVNLVPGRNELNFSLESTDITLEGVTVTASEQKKQSNQQLDIITSSPIFKESTYHAAPSSLPSTILQQNIPGAVQAPTGEVHIRGQHAEYSYYVDGIPIPETQSEEMVELFDPRVIDRITFRIGDLPAEYGDALSVIDVKTKIPATPFQANVSGYAGSFNSSGQSLSFTGHTGNFAYFLAGSRKLTDRRLDTQLPEIFHDHGEDYYGLGKIQYILSPDDIISLDLDYSNSKFQIPFDSTGGIITDDHQKETAGFQNLIYRHGINTEAGTGELYVALTHRQGTSNYIPGQFDAPSFYFAGDSTPYNIQENRVFDVYGGKSTLAIPLSDILSVKGGVEGYWTTGNEHFSAFNGSLLGPQSIETLKGYDFGSYIQTAYTPLPIFQIDAGIRYDLHHADGVITESQISPKFKLTYIPDVATTAYVYYGRIFVPVLVEQLREITGAAGSVMQPTRAVRGNYFEAGAIHLFSTSLSTKIVGYYTEEKPGMDDNTIPGTSIQTPVNIDKIYVRGVELGLDYHPEGPLGGYFNMAVSHAVGVGATTGGFLPAEPPTTAFDLDHDQRITYSVGLNYHPSSYFANIIGSYGSGLTNGQTNGHVNPHLIFDGSAGKDFHLGQWTIRPELFVNNILNHKYLLKGSFFSGAAWGTPRSFMFKLTVSSSTI
ncbi:MAG: TonB-dependent receptor [Candidatus Kryptoniota bacterium]